jgi:monoamine oxidase
VLVLEARDRLGGRTWSEDRNGFHVELGGTWVHWTQPFVWAEKERYGLEVQETPGCVAERVAIKIDGQVQELQESQLGEFVEGFERFFAESKGVWERPYDVHYCWDAVCERDELTVADRLNALELTPLQRTSLGGFLEILSMNQPQNASYVEMMRCWSLTGWNYELFNDTAARYKFTKGTGALVEAMASDGGFDVSLNTSVRAVQQSSDGVCVSTESGELVIAKRAVVTVPLNVLHSVDFEPPLSGEKLEASRLKHVGGGYKVFFEVEGDPGAVMTLSRSTDSPLIGSFTYKRGEQHSVLAGFSLEPGALDKSVEEWQAVLEEFIPGVKLLSTFGHDWGADNLSQGSWATYRPGTVARFSDELPRQEGHLFFASGDHAQGWRGFIEGAIASGSRTAVTVADSLRPQIAGTPVASIKQPAQA